MTGWLQVLLASEEWLLFPFPARPQKKTPCPGPIEWEP